MYQPKKYKKSNKNYIFSFIKNHPFATFILNGKRLLATHIPVLVEGNEEKFILFGHIADNNEQYNFLKNGIEALLIFQGANAYVSSSWYKEKDISTWDYSAVHINVRLKIQTKEELKDSLRKLVGHFEKDQENPFFYEDIPEKMLEEHLPRIRGFWCEPTKIEAIAKLHQGYGVEDVKSVTEHLETKADAGAKKVSEAIKKEHDL